MDERHIWIIVVSVFAFAIAAGILWSLWATPVAMAARIIGTLVLGAVIYMSGKSLWLNLIEPGFRYLKDKGKE